jgi:hypothetical protein
MTDGLPWSGPWPWSPRCRAVRDPEYIQAIGGAYWLGGQYGRCELAPHGPDIDHALERGLETPRWSTRRTA